MFSEIFAYPYLRFWSPCTNQEIIEKGEIPHWQTTDYNYLGHLMRVRDDCFVKYCRAKKEKLKIYMEYKVLRNEVKMKTKQDKKTFPGFIPKKTKKK